MIMKAKPILLVALAAASFVFSSCTTETTTTTTANTDQTNKRVHTQAELRKTGETDTGEIGRASCRERVLPTV